MWLTESDVGCFSEVVEAERHDRHGALQGMETADEMRKADSTEDGPL